MIGVKHTATRTDVLTLISVAVSLVIAIWIGVAGPNGRVPLKMGLGGDVLRWGDRSQAAWLALSGCLLCVVISGACALISRNARASSTLSRSLRLAQAIIGPLTAVATLYAAAAVFGWLKEPAFTGRFNMALISLVIAVIGAVLGKTTANPFIGLRFIWSLTSRRAWDRSNRLMGRLWFWCGLAGLAAAPFAPQPTGVEILVGGVIAAELVATIESWLVWRTDPERRTLIATVRSWGDLFNTRAAPG